MCTSGKPHPAEVRSGRSSVSRVFHPRYLQHFAAINFLSVGSCRVSQVRAKSPINFISVMAKQLMTDKIQHISERRGCTLGDFNSGVWAALPPCAWITWWSTMLCLSWRPTGGWRPVDQGWSRIMASGSSSSGLRWSFMSASLSEWSPAPLERYKTYDEEVRNMMPL